MREFKVGEKIVLEVQEVEPWSNLCIGCFFFSEGCRSMSLKLPCTKGQGSDNTDIIYKEIKEQSV